MPNQTDWAIMGGVAGLGLIAYAATRRTRAAKNVDCSDVANRVGGTPSNPCPTEGPVDVCTQADWDAWVSRVGVQLHAVASLGNNLEDHGLLTDEAFDMTLRSYLRSATQVPRLWDPIWTSASDIAPMVALVGQGCEILNEGNTRLVAAGRPEAVVQESGIVQQYEEIGKRRAALAPWWAKLGIAAGVLMVGTALVKRAA